MQASNKNLKSQPTLPAALVLPLKIIPASIHNKALVAVLNKIFSNDIREGELDFLEGKVLHIKVDDANIEFRLTLQGDRLIAAEKNRGSDIVLRGTVYDYLLLASRSEDTDTLFFNRRLHMQGDTELGLYIKNFLDGMDMDSHKIPGHVGSILKKSLPVYARLFK